jgi:hypothetical protein
MPDILFGHTPSVISNVTFPNELYSFMLNLHSHLPRELDLFFNLKFFSAFYFMVFMIQTDETKSVMKGA